MKTKKIFTVLVTGFLFTGSTLLAQGPPQPPDNPNDGGGPVGGSAPIGAGIGIMLSLAAAYGGAKVYKHFKNTHEDLEE